MKLGKDITAIVTGGASGLGGATARTLAEAGARVAIFDLNAEFGEAHAEAIGASFFKCDVTSESSIDAALKASRDALGAERIVVNCAGIGIAKRISRKNRDTGVFEPHDLATFQRVIQVNLVGTFMMMAKCAANMQSLPPLNEDNERGIIVCTASIAAEDGQIGQVAYAASKGGVMSMTLPVARDLAQSGIRVATIMPGLFHTPMFDGLPDEAREALAASVPFPSRLGKPAEYAALVRHICENVMLNGVSIRLDGSARLAAR